jgi:hypothetical protein
MAQGGIPQGESDFGTPQTRGIVGAIAQATSTNLPGLFHYQTIKNSDGTVLDFYTWVDENGKLRILNAIPANQNADGTIVGTQS